MATEDFFQQRMKEVDKKRNTSTFSNAPTSLPSVAPVSQPQEDDFFTSRMKEVTKIQRAPIERARANMPSLVEFNQNLQSKINTPIATKTNTPSSIPSVTSSNGATIHLIPHVKSNADFRKEWVDEQLQSNKDIPGFLGEIGKAVEPLSRGILNLVSYTSPVAKGLGEGLQIESMGADYNPTTGTKLAEALGTIISPVVAPGNSLGGYGSTIMNVGQNAAAQAAKLSPRLAGRGAQRAVEGAAAGAVEGAYSGTLEGLTAPEMALNIGGGAVLGGALDFGLGAVGDYLRRTREPQTPIVNEQGLTPTDVNVQSARDRINNELIPIRTNVPATREVSQIMPISTNTPQRTMVEFDQNGLPIMSRADETITPNSVSETIETITPDLPIRNLPEAEQQFGINPLQKNAKFTNPEDTRSHIRSRTEREKIDATNVVDKFYKGAVDDIQRINTFDKELEKTLGRKLEPEERAYYKALNSRGSDVISNHIMTERLVDSKGNVVGQSLKSILSQIPSGKSNYTNFTDYLIAKHAITRMGKGQKVYSKETKMDVQKAAQKVAEYEKAYPQFKNVSTELYDWNKQLGQSWLVDTGIVPQQMFNKWIEDNPFWVPNKRYFNEKEKRKGMGQGARGTFANQSKPVKEYSKEGSERDIIDPIESMIEYADKYVKTAKRNEVVQTVYNQLKKTPGMDGWATIVRKEPVKLSDEGIADALDEIDSEKMFNQWKKGDNEKSNVVSVFENGERVYLRIEDVDFLDALANIDSQGQNAVIEASRKLTNVFKNLTTGINPIFGLTRNIFRDIPEGYIFSQTTNNPFKYAWDVLDGFVSVFSDGAYQGIDNSRMLQRVTPDSFRAWLGNRAKLYKDYKSSGGGHSSPIAADRDLLKQTKASLLPQNRINSPLRTGLNVLENLNNALESGTRLGEFKRVLERGGSVDEAVFKAQDVTTNFKRKGNVTRDIDAVVPYMNAAVQGLDKLGRQLKDAPKQTIAKALGVISAPTIALYAINHDDPDYQKLSNYQKDNFYMIPNGDGTFTKIAKPRETGVVFSGALERAMRAWANDDPDAWKDFADTARTMFAPPVIGDLIEGKNPLRSTIGGPLIEVDANENFAGSPIVPQYLENLSPRNQYDANTSEIGKKVGDMLNVSPKQVDHLINAYTGVIGDLLLPATTNVGGTGRPVIDAVNNIGSTLEKQLVVDPRLSTDASKDFYELKDKIETTYRDALATEEIPQWYNDEYRKAMNDVASTMSDYTKALREIDKNKDLSKNEKKELRLELTDERNSLARNAYQVIIDAIRAAE